MNFIMRSVLSNASTALSAPLICQGLVMAAYMGAPHRHKEGLRSA
jgi:hypothetical protein